MASVSPSKDVEEEATCAICMEYLTDPVTLDCGHNYCRRCITDYCAKWEDLQVGGLNCPLCGAKIQKGNFRPNWQLANIVEKIKLLPLNTRGKDLCTKHNESLHLFCKEDEELLCWVCERSPEHKSHTVVVKEQAAQEYKDLMDSCLKTLREEQEKILSYKADVEKESNDLLSLAETERQKAEGEFRKLRQFIEEQEKLLLNQLEQAEEEIAAKRDQLVAILSENLSSLQRIIQEMEQNHQQPARELLQDVRSTLHRYEKRKKVEKPEAFPSELKSKISEFCDINPLLEGVVKQLKAGMSYGSPEKKEAASDPEDALNYLEGVLNYIAEEPCLSSPFLAFPTTAKVTLDPDTANSRLVLFDYGKSVKWEAQPQNLPDNPERFRQLPFVLGCEGFKAGRHSWEVIVGSGEGWAVGVARKSVKRKEYFPLSPEEGIWAVGKWLGEYRACRPPDYPPLSLSAEPRGIQVTVNYEWEEVSFFDADTTVLLYTFSGASFSGETLFPFFYLCGGETHLRIA